MNDTQTTDDGRLFWSRPDAERADITMDLAGRSWTVTATKTDDGVWVAKCREVPDWTAKGTLADIECAFTDQIYITHIVKPRRASQN